MLKRVLLILVILFLSSCQGTQTGEPTAVPPTPQQEAAETMPEAETAVIDIESESGIGEETFTRPDAGWASAIVLRFHLPGLEEMKLTFGDTAVTVNILSHGQNEVHQSVSQNGQNEAIAINADSPYWLPVMITNDDGSEGTIPLQNGTIDISLPAAFFDENPASFSVNWIDFYR